MFAADEVVWAATGVSGGLLPACDIVLAIAGTWRNHHAADRQPQSD